MNERIYLSPPDIGELEEQAVLAAMRGGWIAPLGPEVDAFERELADRVGVKYGVALSSGTAALHLALLTLGAAPGTVVVTSTMTFAATTNAIAYTGAEPYFVDCVPETGNMDPELLRLALLRLREERANVVAVLPVDLLGKPVDYASIEDIASEFEVPVLSDAAESLGATFHGRPTGSFGVASVFSFNGNKVMTTSGGGMLMTDDEAMMTNARYLATQARQPVVHYEHHDVGYNYRMSNLLAALGRAQLSRLDDMIARRRQLRDEYKAFFKDVGGVEVFGTEDDEQDNVWLTAISIDRAVTGWTARELADELLRHQIESRPLWKPMHLQPVFSAHRGEISGAAEHLFETHLTLPSGSATTPDQKTFVFEKLSEFLRG